MKIKLRNSFLVFLFICKAFGLPRIYVDPYSTEFSSCGNVSTPCKTIKDALSNVSEDFTIISLGEGVYRGAGNQNINVSDLTNSKNLSISGVSSASVFIQCEQIELQKKLSGAGALEINNNSISLLENVTISSCGWDAANGAVKVSDTSLIVRNVNFLNNSASFEGGALSATSSQDTKYTVKIINCTFVSNKASYHGGALSIDSADEILISHSQFYLNSALGGTLGDNKSLSATGGGRGGALFVIKSTTLSIEDCDFNDNTATQWGGAISVQFPSLSPTAVPLSTSSINECNFTNNVVFAASCTAADSSCDSRGGALYMSNSQISLSKSYFIGNIVSISSGDQVPIFQSVFFHTLVLSISFLPF